MYWINISFLPGIWIFAINKRFIGVRVRVSVFNATFNNISAILW
jgi:hypothetical protein